MFILQLFVSPVLMIEGRTKLKLPDFGKVVFATKTFY